jgi:divalent metal cation (Fe/Co/Zn/Cd) transporter
MVNFSIFVDGNLSTFDSHEIANNLEKEIGEKVPEIYLTIIHVNPMKIDRKKDTK